MPKASPQRVTGRASVGSASPSWSVACPSALVPSRSSPVLYPHATARRGPADSGIWSLPPPPPPRLRRVAAGLGGGRARHGQLGRGVGRLPPDGRHVQLPYRRRGGHAG